LAKFLIPVRNEISALYTLPSRFGDVRASLLVGLCHESKATGTIIIIPVGHVYFYQSTVLRATIELTVDLANSHMLQHLWKLWLGS